MNVKALDGLAPSEYQAPRENHKLQALISQLMSKLETHKAFLTVKENLLSLTASEPIY